MQRKYSEGTDHNLYLKRSVFLNIRKETNALQRRRKYL